MRKILDWLFLSNRAYFDKYVLPERLGRSPYLQITAWEVRPRQSFVSKVLVFIVGGFWQ